MSVMSLAASVNLDAREAGHVAVSGTRVAADSVESRGSLLHINEKDRMIEIEIDPGAAVPPFAQLREVLISRIAEGSLAPGTKLPPVRTLAAELGLAANTVARSYKELEAAGFVQTQGRGGTIVAPNLDDAERHRKALQLTREYVAAMAAIGVSSGEAKEYLGRVS